GWCPGRRWPRPSPAAWPGVTPAPCASSRRRCRRPLACVRKPSVEANGSSATRRAVGPVEKAWAGRTDGRHAAAMQTLASHPVRLARPSRDLAAAERFWVDGAGLEVLWRTGEVADGEHELLMVGP